MKKAFPYLVGILILAYILGQIATWLAERWNLFSSPTDQAKWFVEILILIFGSIIASVMLRFALREKEPPMPSLILDGHGMFKTEGGDRLFGIRVKNEGDYAAIDCVASLEIKEIEELDIPSPKRLPAFQGLDTGLNVELCWDLTAEKKKTLISDDWGRLFVARWIPTNRGKAEHFAIVGNRGWSSTSMKLAAAPGYYFGKVKITPWNGKAYYVSFCLRKDKLEGPVLDIVS
jgi:hypothetical protein